MNKQTTRSPLSKLTRNQKNQIETAIAQTRMGKMIVFTQETQVIDTRAKNTQVISGPVSVMKADLLGYMTYLNITKKSTVLDIVSFVKTYVRDILARHLTAVDVEEILSALESKIQTSNNLPQTMTVEQIWTRIFGIQNITEATFGQVAEGLITFVKGKKTTRSNRFTPVSKHNVALAKRIIFMPKAHIQADGEKNLWIETPALVLLFVYNDIQGSYEFLAIEENMQRREYYGSYMVQLDPATFEGTKKVLKMVEKGCTQIAKHFNGLTVNVKRTSDLAAVANDWSKYIASINGHNVLATQIQKTDNMVTASYQQVARAVDADYSHGEERAQRIFDRELQTAGN